MLVACGTSPLLDCIVWWRMSSWQPRCLGSLGVSEFLLQLLLLTVGDLQIILSELQQALDIVTHNSRCSCQDPVDSCLFLVAYI